MSTPTAADLAAELAEFIARQEMKIAQLKAQNDDMLNALKYAVDEFAEWDDSDEPTTHQAAVARNRARKVYRMMLGAIVRAKSEGKS